MHTPQQFCFEAYRLDVPNEQLWHGPRSLHLTPKAVRVLHYLLEHAGQLVTKVELFQSVWPEAMVSDGVLTNCIGELRQALGDPTQTSHFIQTVHRRGYRFLVPVTVTAGRAAADDVNPPPPCDRGPRPNPVVGRETEVTYLRRCLERARQGTRQVVFVTGEAGMGKTTVVDAFLATVGGEAPIRVAWGQCLDHYGAGEAYLPVLDALGRLCREPGQAQFRALLGQYAPSWLMQMPALLSRSEREVLERRALGANRERMLRELAEALEAVAAERPLVFVLEDLHWSDHATLDLVAWLARRREPARLLLLGTYRPVEVIVRGHPLKAIKQDLALHRQCVELRLEGLHEAAVAAYLAERLPHHPVPADLGRVLHRRTDGHPLFMVETVDAWMRQGRVRESTGQWIVPGKPEALEEGIPESVRQMIEQQLDELSPDTQRMLEAASVVGSMFTAAAVAAGLEAAVGLVEEQCEGLVRRGQFLCAQGVEEWPDGTVAGRYGFLHTLHQQVVYDRLPPSRRLQLHGRIGLREEAGYRERTGEHAAELAVHFDRGRDIPRALRYLREAAATAGRRYAYPEAIGHLTRGLELLQLLPDSRERVRQELALQTSLGPALMAVKGYAATEVGRAYDRARELCRQVKQTPQLFSVLAGLHGFYLARAELATARELAEQLLRLAQGDQAPAHILRAHAALGKTLSDLGELAGALAEFRHGIGLYDPQRHRSHAFHAMYDPGVWCLSYGAVVLWILGYPEQALQQNQEALTLAQERAHPLDFARTLNTAAVLHQCRREAPAAQARAEAAMALARAQAFPQPEARGMVLRGWALVEQGQDEEGLVQMRQGIAALQALGAELNRPHLMALLAGAHARVGQRMDGLAVVVEALGIVKRTGMRSSEAELQRLQGEILLRQAAGRVSSQDVPVSASTPAGAEAATVSAAETSFRQALDVAHRQQAKSWELRAATSLARLRQQQGKQGEAYELLAPVYSWFTEGFDTADLQEAKALLEELS